MRDLSFFEKQKQRIERFDKAIMQYLLMKERELVLECPSYHSLRQNQEQIRALITLEMYFNRGSTFI